jgi:hypothetical protein
MGDFFDEAARILASQMPRRKAFKLLGGALVGGIVAALGTQRAMAATPECTDNGQSSCKCTKTPGGSGPSCAANYHCCGFRTPKPVCCSGAKCCNITTGTCDASAGGNGGLCP